MNTTTTKDPQIARTIVSQLGNLSLSMMGAYNILDLGNGLSFRIKGSRSINYIAIELDASDTYSVRTAKIGRSPNFKVSNDDTAADVYADSLHTHIEAATGLLTRF